MVSLMAEGLEVGTVDRPGISHLPSSRIWYSVSSLIATKTPERGVERLSVVNRDFRNLDFAIASCYWSP